MATLNVKTNAQVSALVGEAHEILDYMRWPDDTTGAAPRRQKYTFWDQIIDLALDKPDVDDANYLPPIKYFEDWILGGHCPDAALVDESDPAAKISEVADRGEWLASITDGGAGTAITILDGMDGYPGGWLYLKTGGNQNDQISMQINGESFQLDVGLPLYFEARIAVGDVDATDWFVGLATNNTDVTNAAGNDHVGFKAAHVASISYTSDKDGGGPSTADTAVDFADADADGSGDPDLSKAKRLSFYWDGVSDLSFYVDGVLIDTINTTDDNICDDEAMSPIIGVDATQGAAAEALFVDYLMIVQQRT